MSCSFKKNIYFIVFYIFLLLVINIIKNSLMKLFFFFSFFIGYNYLKYFKNKYYITIILKNKIMFM